ncbi:MAG: hypothetical protein QG610_692 [Euryarchaeota archaeon]|nr:hypothetical protein [Euryarchaeota archaeon]
MAKNRMAKNRMAKNRMAKKQNGKKTEWQKKDGINSGRQNRRNREIKNGNSARMRPE